MLKKCISDLLSAISKKPCSQDKANQLLLYSAEEGIFDGIKKALSMGADINTKNDKRYSALHLTAIFGHLDCLQYLIDNNANIDAKTMDGLTALHLSIRNGEFDCFKHLLERNADPRITLSNHDISELYSSMDYHAVNADNFDSVHLAIYHSRLKFITVLLNIGVDNGLATESPLELATRLGKTNIAQLIASHTEKKVLDFLVQESAEQKTELSF